MFEPELEPYFGKTFRDAVSKGASVWNMKYGLGSIPQTLAERIENMPNANVYLDTRVEQIRREDDGTLTVTTPDGNRETFDVVFSAISPVDLGNVLDTETFPSAFLQRLGQFNASQVFVYLVELENMILPKDLGFGFLVPTCEDENLLGVIYDSCTMPEHDAAGARFTVMSRKPTDPLAVLSGIEIRNNESFNFCICTNYR